MPYIFQSYSASKTAPACEHKLTPNTSSAMIIGEFGVCVPFFILGTMIVLYYGKSDETDCALTKTLFSFFKSPIFIAMLLGIICSIVGLPQNNKAIKIMLELFSIIGNSMILLVAISIGLMLKPVALKKLLPVIILVAVIKLVIEPLFIISGTSIFGVCAIDKQVLLIEAAMPSAAVAPVLADRYGCDGGFATVVMLATYILSLVSLPVMFYFGITY